jgi:peptidoglycan/LPS O-acetylase OafA/YrhL
MPLTPKRSLISIDIARAIAALGVFYYHQHIGLVLAKYTGIKWLDLTNSFGALYAVPFFFLISGYCVHLSNIKYLKAAQLMPLKDYYKRRWLRIYPPYVFAVLFSVVINSITVPGYALTHGDLFTHLFALQGFTKEYFNTVNVVLWTITIEMAFYILYPVFYYLRLKFSLTYAMIFTLLISGISIAYFSSQIAISLPQYYCVFNLWFAWCCGAFLADKQAFNKQVFEKGIYRTFYLLIIVAFILIKVYFPANRSIIAYQLNILIFTAPLVFLINKEDWLMRRPSIIQKILIAIGVSSYSLYLFHEPLIAIKNYLVHQYLPSKLQPAGVLMGILIIPFITWLSYRYIEKPFIAKKRKVVISE